jgi:hypothetical protein
MNVKACCSPFFEKNIFLQNLRRCLLIPCLVSRVMLAYRNINFIKGCMHLQCGQFYKTLCNTPIIRWGPKQTIVYMQHDIS